MTAHDRIVPADSPDPLKALAGAGHAFRGRFLDKCALIERWAAAILEASGKKRSATRLFGQKIEAVRALASAEPSPLKAPKRVLDLLDALKPFVDHRSRLAHGIQTVAQTENGTGLVIFAPIPGAGPTGLKLVLDREDMAVLVQDLSKIAKELGDQRLKVVTPSAPPPPKPAAAAGP